MRDESSAWLRGHLQGPCSFCYHFILIRVVKPFGIPGNLKTAPGRFNPQKRQFQGKKEEPSPGVTVTRLEKLLYNLSRDSSLGTGRSWALGGGREGLREEDQLCRNRSFVSSHENRFLGCEAPAECFCRGIHKFLHQPKCRFLLKSLSPSHEV